MFTAFLTRTANLTAAIVSAALLTTFVTLPPAQAQVRSAPLASVGR